MADSTSTKRLVQDTRVEASGSGGLPRQITDPESGVTATVSGSLSTGIGYKYRMVLISFNDLEKVVAFPVDIAEELVESLQKQVKLLRRPMN